MEGHICSSNSTYCLKRQLSEYEEVMLLDELVGLLHVFFPQFCLPADGLAVLLNSQYGL